jgi:arginyl-tRNA--protein-N-Asp/Glu arginylyltransferase
VKLLFSEADADYSRYQYSYAIWALPETGETPASLFNAGFMPGSPQLDRFYLCRQIRVALAQFELSSENRRILRKGEGVNLELVPRAQFDYTPARREFFRTYAAARFSQDTMSYERLDALFSSPVVSHLLVFTDAKTGAEVGVVLLYLEGDALAFYYYAFYDLNYFNRSLGMFMMTSSAEFFASRGTKHLYLGTCYSERALYKTQFAGGEFFNGFRWSQNWEELKYLLRRDQEKSTKHLLETVDFREQFYAGDLAKITAASGFIVKTT